MGRLLVGVLAACLLAGVSAIAHAQVPDPGQVTVPDDPASTVPDPYATGEQAARTDCTVSDACENGLPDTDQTPDTTKTSDLWTLVGGAVFPISPDDDPTRLVEGSVTGFADDLYDVAFKPGNKSLGFAAGSTCRVEPQRLSGETDAAFGGRVRSCADANGIPGDRIPGLYLYRRTTERGLAWERVDLPGDDQPGYIGAIAWNKPTGDVLAVGGNGTYPKREPAYGQKGYRGSYGSANAPPRDCDPDPDQPFGAACDETGEGRAWLLHDGVWREITEELPQDPSGEPPRGFTAVDFSPSVGRNLGFAGGLGQIYRWDGPTTGGGGFTKRWDMHSPDFGKDDNRTEMLRAKVFRFRVREIEFLPGAEPPVAYAVTGGCCAGLDPGQDPTAAQSSTLGPVHNSPQILGFSQPGTRPARWTVSSLDPTQSGYAQGALPVELVESLGPGTLAEDRELHRPNSRHDLPNSFYSLTVHAVGGLTANEQIQLSVIATPGGTPEVESPERPSIVTSAYCTSKQGSAMTQAGASESNLIPDQLLQGTRQSLSTARLHSGDGDVFMAYTRAADRFRGAPSDLNQGFVTCGNGQEHAGNPGDGVPDWSVGELRSTGRGLGGQALALSTALRPSLTPDTLKTNPTEAELLGGSYQPTSPEKASAYLRSQYFRLPSYSLNSIDMIDPTGTGWAVGDHGALVRIGGESDTAAIERDPPKLGNRQPAEAPDASPYQSLRPPPAGEPGVLPALATRPLERLPEPIMLPGGYPDPARPQVLPIEDVSQIVMSRDGAEGWALGSSNEANSLSSAGAQGDAATLSLFHFDGLTWSRCETDGLKGQFSPDPACADLASLRLYANQNGIAKPVRILTATRIPYERDANPANDDEFEIVALATTYRRQDSDPEQPVLLRYRGGRWFVDPDTSVGPAIGNTAIGSFAEPTMVFATPTEGWILIKGVGSVLHYDGTGWVNCTPAGGDAPPGCADPDGLLTLAGAGGDRDSRAGLTVAGERVYLFGQRTLNGDSYPMIVYRDPGGSWSADPAQGGYDPVWAARQPGGVQPDGSEQGTVASIALADLPDGYAGWAVGQFRSRSIRVGNPLAGGGQLSQQDLPAETALMRLRSGEGWEPYPDDGPVEDYIAPAMAETAPTERMQVTIPAGSREPLAFIAQRRTGRIFAFNPDRGRFELLRQGRPLKAQSPSPVNTDGWLDAPVQTIAPDNHGGFWAALRVDGEGLAKAIEFRHFTDRAPRPVFHEAVSPLRSPSESITALTGSADGTVWATSRSDVLYRYDRVTGWARIRIPGWDPGRVVTRQSEANAVALNAEGNGIVVGREGRIADLSGRVAQLNQAAGTLCVAEALPPCGTGHDLRAAAVAPGGSALAGGDNLALLGREGEGPFHAIERPPAPPSSTITGLTMPDDHQAWLSTNLGTVYMGTESGGHWSWEAENLNADGEVLSDDGLGGVLALRSISVDQHGHGYAVGDRGLILQRTAGDGTPWRRLQTPFLDNLTSVALPVGGAHGAIIGGRNGLILTASGDRVELARAADHFSGWERTTGPVTGMAILPGSRDGETEAWVATRNHNPNTCLNCVDRNQAQSQLFHYASDPQDPWLNPQARTRALADAPPPTESELSFAAFGRSECRYPVSRPPCFEMNGGTLDYERSIERIVNELTAAAGQSGGPDLAVFTGDLADTGGHPAAGQTEETSGGLQLQKTMATLGQTSGLPRKQRRWREMVADPLVDRGVPVFAGVGGQDLSDVPVCWGAVGCGPTKGALKSGENLSWRASFADAPAPWGEEGEGVSSGGYSFREVSQEGSVDPGNQPVPDLDGDGGIPQQTLRTGGARTHYAFDVHDRDGTAVARFVFVDTSLRSLAASDPMQHPIEPDGQLTWLDQMLCREGESATGGGACTRQEDQAAVVVTNTPTYSYGPGGLTDTNAADGTQLEQVLFDHGVDLVVSGRLGWNGLYYATAPGLHYPCPGDPYPAGPPTSATGCAAGPEGAPDPVATAIETRDQICATTQGAPMPDPKGCTGTGGGLAGAIPFVVAASAGGKFGPDGQAQGSAADGFWRGYSLVRLRLNRPPSDPGRVIVEQRPVFDWVTISAAANVVRAGKTMNLQGIGREPLGIDSSTDGLYPVTTRYDDISTPAVTHRYDLLAADPAQPWLPEQGSESDDCDPYDCLPSNVATVDRQSGVIRAGNGQYPRTFAIAQLSVGEKSSSYPLVFEPRASFKAPAPPPPVPVAVPAPPPPPAAAPPTNPTVNLPSAPVLPVLTAQALTPPPVPPSPPTFASEAPLDLTISPAALDVTPPTAVSQPPTPPVNPAPPSGARREARQRQAAAQKSGADSDASEQADDAAGDLAEGPRSPHGSEMTRHDFTAIADREQPSAWARDALLGGGLGIAALILALGVRTARPTPRRRQPELPAPAWARYRRGLRR